MKRIAAFITQTGGTIMATRCATVILAVLVTLAAGSYDTQAQGSTGNPGVIPPNARFRGLTYGEWEARYWQAAFALPVVDGDHPLISGGTFEGENGVLFLAAPVGSSVTINLTIPPGTPLFVPVITVECSEIEPDPFHGDDETELRTCANGHIDNTSGLFAEIDGRPVNNLDTFRVESPLFRFGPLPANNVLPICCGVDPPPPAGTTSLSVADGVFLLFAPLSVGEHTLHVDGTITVGEFDFSIDATFEITVEPGNP
jgi:hypothetical protein